MVLTIALNDFPQGVEVKADVIAKTFMCLYGE